MPADRHLNQLEFPGMPERSEVPSVEEDRVYTRDDIPYRDDDAHRAFRWNRTGDPLNAPNPIFDEDVWSKWGSDVDSSVAEGKVDQVTSQEFIPPWKVGSSQPNVNADAVEHQVRNANPLALREDPSIHPYSEGGEERYMVTEGNHRVLAAQRRGQLLMPANVERLV